MSKILYLRQHYHFGAGRIADYLRRFHQVAVARSTVHRLLGKHGVAIWPVACAFQYYGFESLLPQGRFVEHFTSVRAGTMTVVDMTDLEGMVSLPSFHVAGALIVTWALRRSWWLCLPVAILNLGLIASTIMAGSHYAIDIVAAVLLVVFSVVFYQRIVEPWWRGRTKSVTL